MTLRATAGASPFAHLLGLGRASAAKTKAESEEDREEKQDREEREKDEEDDDKKTKGAKAESDDDEKKDDDDKKDAKKAKGKKAEVEDVDDDDGRDEEEMRGKSAASDARARERFRCARIFTSPAAAKRPDMAASLAFGTMIGANAAIALLEASAVGIPDAPAASAPAQPAASSSRRSLDERMAALNIPTVASGPAAGNAGTKEPTMAEKLLAADKKRRGEA